MAKAKKFELKSSAPILDGKDEEMLAPIDEGTRDAKAGRTAPAEEVRKRLPKWITAPLHSPPTTNVGASGAPALHFRWATMADRKRRFRWFAEFCTSCLARLSPEPFEHYLPQACPDAVVRLRPRLFSRFLGIFSFSFLPHPFAPLHPY